MVDIKRYVDFDPKESASMKKSKEMF